MWLVLRIERSEARFLTRAPVDNGRKEDSTVPMSAEGKLTREMVERLLREAAPGVRELGDELHRVIAPSDWRKRLR